MELISSVLSAMSWLLCMGVTLWGGYYLVIGLMSWRRPLDYGWHPARTRFAVLIPARNEELVIGTLINSLLAQDYPADLYDIWVIPNHCSDRTAEAARQFGAKVLECAVPVKNKGEVLRFAYHRLHGRRYDAYCVFDADNIADRRFLAEMNNAYLAGAKAAQGYRDSKNPYDTVVSGCYSIYYWMMNRFHNGGRAGLGLSAMVNGTGFMVSARTLENLGGWHTQTISEDLEITAQTILAGEKICWVPKAITYDEQPLNYAQSVKQRRRWTCGTIQVAEEYLGETGRAIQTSNRLWSLADLGATLLIPSYQMAALAGLLVSSFAACMNCYRLEQVPAAFLGTAVLQLMMTALGSTLAAVLVLTVERKWDKRLVKTLLVYWLFLLSWVPITIGSFLKQTTEWEEIRHTQNVVPEAILKS
ncbi:MAG: glycosyltransferase family 2 protein [Lawsonibacter sp.]|nr:glycosyltransferase family 2 protein [Lawsonibacter sp.]